MGDGDSVLGLGREVHELLQRIVRDLSVRKAGGHLVEALLETIELRLSVAVRETEGDAERFSHALTRSVEQVLDEAVQHAAAFRPGHAYCHRCSGAACEHSCPPSCRHVFAGYTLTGTPRWEDFAQWCLDRMHPDVDRLYQQPPAFLTFFQDARELEGAMLRAFASGPYRLVGQVTAGFFPIRTRLEEGRGVLAITLQAGASRLSRGRVRYGINVLGRAPGGGPLEALWDRQDRLPWHRSARWAQAALDSVSSRVNATPGRRRAARAAEEGDGRVIGILNGLARRLERDRRSRSRRTRHAEERHESKSRPTRKAWDDARSAGVESCLIDERAGTLVVLGERGRTHFFTREGRLVSSVRYRKDAIERKIKLELWRPATEQDLLTLQEGLDG